MRLLARESGAPSSPPDLRRQRTSLPRQPPCRAHAEHAPGRVDSSQNRSDQSIVLTESTAVEVPAIAQRLVCARCPTSHDVQQEELARLRTLGLIRLAVRHHQPKRRLCRSGHASRTSDGHTLRHRVSTRMSLQQSCLTVCTPFHTLSLDQRHRPTNRRRTLIAAWVRSQDPFRRI